MFLKRHPLALTAASAVVALLLAVAPVSADRGGNRGGYNGGNRGGYNGGYRGGYNGGWNNGYRGGYNGGWNNGYRGGYNGGYYPGYFSSGLYLNTTPYSNYSYAPTYSYAPSVDNTTPSFYYAPPSTELTAAPAAADVPDNQARVEVRVPAPDAQVLFNGAVTQQQGTDRMFVSPPLDAGRTYSYDIEARWMDNGRMVDQTKTVTVTAGQTAAVDFGR